MAAEHDYELYRHTERYVTKMKLNRYMFHLMTLGGIIFVTLPHWMQIFFALFLTIYKIYDLGVIPGHPNMIFAGMKAIDRLCPKTLELVLSNQDIFPLEFLADKNHLLNYSQKLTQNPTNDSIMNLRKQQVYHLLNDWKISYNQAIL